MVQYANAEFAKAVKHAPPTVNATNEQRWSVYWIAQDKQKQDQASDLASRSPRETNLEMTAGCWGNEKGERFEPLFHNIINKWGIIV
jgi:hypothetical protein